jgi:hypothetical protein
MLGDVRTTRSVSYITRGTSLTLHCRNCDGPTFLRSAGRVPSHADHADPRTDEERGAKAPGQRTARGRLLRGDGPPRLPLGTIVRQ